MIEIVSRVKSIDQKTSPFAFNKLPYYFRRSSFARVQAIHWVLHNMSPHSVCAGRRVNSCRLDIRMAQHGRKVINITAAIPQ